MSKGNAMYTEVLTTVWRGVRRQRVSPDAAHPGLSRRQRRERKRAEVRRARADYYERGTFWGKPAACTMLELAQQLHMDNRHYLWYAITPSLPSLALCCSLDIQSATQARGTSCDPATTSDCFVL